MKKQLLLPLASAALLVAMLAGCAPQGDTPNNTSVPTSTPSSNSTAKSVSLNTTTQYDNAFTYLATDIPSGTANASREEVLVAGWTAREYVFAALENPYLLAGYWGTKDKYIASGVEDVTNYLSGAANEQFEAHRAAIAKSPTSAEGQAALAAFTQIMYMPTTNDELTLDSTCYDTWDMGSCRRDEVVISDIAVKDGENGAIIINLKAKATPLFTDYEGVVVEPRTYTYEFILKKTTPPVSIDTEIPIYTIDSINGSLVIDPTEKLF